MLAGIFYKSHVKMHSECFEDEVFMYLGSGSISRFRSGIFTEMYEAGWSP